MFFSVSKPKAVKQATVEFSESHKIASWSSKDGTLLDLAESIGISTLSCCRNGHCGSCVVELISGEIVYEQEISAQIQGKQIILCSAKPLTAHIKIKI
jgi:uncharacterized protein